MKYIFYIAKLYSIPIYKPLVKYLETTNDEFAFYVSDKVKNNFPSEWDNSLILQNLRDAQNYNPDFILSSGNYVDFRIPGVKVQIFHGLGIEKPAHYKIRHFYDVYLTSGPVVTKKFLKLKTENKDYFEVLETGWAKIDYILNYPTENLKEKLEIPNNKKIILYAPTFSNSMESASKVVTKIENLLRDDEFWLLKFHEFSDKKIIALFKKKSIPNVKVVNTYDITPFLKVADIMISDTSSVVYEFMVLNKPVITINTISRKDKGIDVTDIEEIRPAIDKLKLNPTFLNKNIQKHLLEVNPYLDGKIAKRIFDNLQKLSKDAFPKKNKPFNLLRKIDFVYTSIIRKGYLK